MNSLTSAPFLNTESRIDILKSLRELWQLTGIHPGATKQMTIAELLDKHDLLSLRLDLSLSGKLATPDAARLANTANTADELRQLFA
jgi:hypothetical protein